MILRRDGLMGSGAGRSGRVPEISRSLDKDLWFLEAHLSTTPRHQRKPPKEIHHELFSHKMQRIAAGAALLAAGAFWAGAPSGADGQQAGVQPPADKSLAQQIVDTMLQARRIKPGYRPVHAKGIGCQG